MTTTASHLIDEMVIFCLLHRISLSYFQNLCIGSSTIINSRCDLSEENEHAYQPSPRGDYEIDLVNIPFDRKDIGMVKIITSSSRVENSLIGG